MSRRKATLCFALWMLLVGISAGATDDGGPDSETEQIETFYGQPIDNGFVIFDGQYLPPPYIVGRRGDAILVNEHLIPDEGFVGRFRGRRPRGPGPWGRGSGRGWQHGDQDRRSSTLAHIERQLDEDALLIVLEDGPSGFVHSTDPIYILDALLSDATNEAKIEALMTEGVPWLSSADWSRLVEKFQPTPDLAERVRAVLNEYQSVPKPGETARGRSKWLAFVDSAPFRYGVTVAAMLLAVIATGTLLTHRPASGVRWRDVDSGGDGIGMVIRNVVLLSVLGGFDLLLTLAAQQAGGFLELNPLGAELVGSPLLLCTFKTTAFVGACVILIVLRNYRGAQVASWWLCLVCTIVTFRWLTYNSLFVA